MVLFENITRLRKLRALDLKAYKSLKTMLPYLVGSAFKENIRNSEHFETARYLVLDIDDFFNEKSYVIPQNICEHPEVLIAFISPSGTGFKLIFKLERPCSSLTDYKEFYKNYARKFADQVSLEGSIDFKTCDATRACFLSHDPNATYNAEALTIQWENYIAAKTINFDENEEPLKEINAQALQKVLTKINPSKAPKREKNVFMPDQILELEGDIKSLCIINEFHLVGLVHINYGLKVQIKKGYCTAEVNIFFGKKGYSIIQSPKTGSDFNLGVALHSVLSGLIFKEYISKPIFEPQFAVSVN